MADREAGAVERQERHDVHQQQLAELARIPGREYRPQSDMGLRAEHDVEAERGRQEATKKPAVTPTLRSSAEQGEGGAGGA